MPSQEKFDEEDLEDVERAPYFLIVSERPNHSHHDFTRSADWRAAKKKESAGTLKEDFPKCAQVMAPPAELAMTKQMIDQAFVGKTKRDGSYITTCPRSAAEMLKALKKIDITAKLHLVSKRLPQGAIKMDYIDAEFKANGPAKKEKLAA